MGIAGEKCPDLRWASLVDSFAAEIPAGVDLHHRSNQFLLDGREQHLPSYNRGLDAGQMSHRSSGVARVGIHATMSTAELLPPGQYLQRRPATSPGHHYPTPPAAF